MAAPGKRHIEGLETHNMDHRLNLGVMVRTCSSACDDTLKSQEKRTCNWKAAYVGDGHEHDVHGEEYIMDDRLSQALRREEGVAHGNSIQAASMTKYIRLCVLHPERAEAYSQGHCLGKSLLLTIAMWQADMAALVRAAAEETMSLEEYLHAFVRQGWGGAYEI